MQLEELRKLIQTIDGSAKREYFPFSLCEPGFPKGSLVEIQGPGKSELTAKFLAQNPCFRVAWIEKEISIYPFAFIQHQAGLSRILFVEASQDYLWAALQILQSQAFQIVILSQIDCDEKALRRLQLAAEKSHATVIFLSQESKKTWVPIFKIKARRDNEGLVHSFR